MFFLKKWMTLALEEAKMAGENNEIPVGAIIVKDNRLIAVGRNMREETNIVSAHAEINALSKACKTLDSWKLEGCDMYVTLEPCPMCAGAIIQARISNLFIGTCDNRWGAAGSTINLFNIESFNHKVNVFYDIMENDSKKLLKSFFKKLRNRER